MAGLAGFLFLNPMNLAPTLVSLFFLSLLLSHVSASFPELRSLLEFKKGIQIDPLGKVFDSWDQSSLTDYNDCPHSWTGVYCSDGTGNISSIVLDGFQLSGELKFQTLVGLGMLKNLSLSGNRFSGRLPPALGTMTSLQHLDLSGNQFYGPIPARINELWGLTYLNLSKNQFKGGFPSGMTNLQQLRVLDLHSNELWGDIADVLSTLRNVEYVDLSYNKFYGGLELALENMSNLANTVHHLNLSHNNLNGGFFKQDSIGMFRNLQVLDLVDNQIRGELPSFGALPSLRLLRLANNLLFGSVPEELLETSMPIEELDLSGNGFTGSIPLINSSTLTTLNLSSNGLSGPLPSSLSNCMIVDLSRNMLFGDMSIMEKWEASLEVLDLSSNKLFGTFPNLTMQFDRLTTLNLRNNSLTGPLPYGLGSYQKLSAVDFSSNELNGPIPGSFFSSGTLTSLNLSGNHFTGQLPFQGSRASELLVMTTSWPIQYLDLSSNSLIGALPSDIEKMGDIKLLNLAKNGFSGQLPYELSKLSYLEVLDLSQNNFTGKIPDKLAPSLTVFNVSYNDLSGSVPENLMRFPISSFRPENDKLLLPSDSPEATSVSNFPPHGRHRNSRGNIRIAIIVASVGAAVMIVFVLLAYHRAQLKDFRGRSQIGGQDTRRDVKSRPSIFKFNTNAQPRQTSLSFSNDHLLTSNSRSLSGQVDFVTETSDPSLPQGAAAGASSVNPNLLDNHPISSGRKSSPGSPLSSSPRFIEAREPGMLDVYSPDRLAGELHFMDGSLALTAEELSRAPAEVLGRSSHGTLYKATLDSGHMLTVKWLRVGLVKHKKEFAREVRRIGSMKHPNIVSLRAYYWGPREQERLLLADYVHGDSLALHLYETTPRRYSPLSFNQRLKVAVEVARCLLHLHDRGLPHGNLKPTNVLLAGPEYNARLSDYGLHRLMTPAGIAEQILNLGALGYRAPELAAASKPVPTLKADVYALGVILMELLTRRSAGDIISGQSGAVDLTDWVRLCDQEGRGMDCIDRDIAGGEEPSKAMDELLSISLRCILPVNERPNIRQVLDDLCSVSV